MRRKKKNGTLKTLIEQIYADFCLLDIERRYFADIITLSIPTEAGIHLPFLLN